jgi:hypothetical protein
MPFSGPRSFGGRDAAPRGSSPGSPRLVTLDVAERANLILAVLAVVAMASARYL